MRERPNRHDWKSCEGKPSVGSNPTSSATGSRRELIASCLRESSQNIQEASSIVTTERSGLTATATVRRKSANECG